MNSPQKRHWVVDKILVHLCTTSYNVHLLINLNTNIGLLFFYVYRPGEACIWVA